MFASFSLSFVDDMTFVSKSKDAIAAVKIKLRKHFKFRNLGPVNLLLGVEVERDRPNLTIQLSQSRYTNDNLTRYGFADCSPVTTPMNLSHKLSKADAPKTKEEVREMRFVPYAAAVVYNTAEVLHYSMTEVQ